MKNNNYIYLAVGLLLFSNHVRAEESSFNLGEIVVSGEKQRIVESVGTVDVVTAEDIKRSGARNLNEAIKLLPGLYVRTGGDGTPRIDIRGLRTRQVILLLDGVPINSAIDGQFDPSAIDVANIERIKVTRGTSSLLYGTGGTAGVINIITKSGGTGWRGNALAEFGQGGSRRGQSSLSNGGEDWNAFVSASGFHRDNFDLSEDYDPVPVTGAPNPNNFQPAGDRINSDRTDSNLYGNFVWQGLPRTEIGISGSYRKGHYGKPGEVRDFTGADADPFARRPRFERVDDFEGVSLNITGQHNFDIPLTIRPLLYFNRLDEETNNYDDSTFTTITQARSFHQNTRSDIFGGGLQANYDFANFGFSSAALNCRREQWHTAGFEMLAAGGGGGGGGGGGATLSQLLIDASQDVCSAGIEHEIQLTERIGFVAGVGYDWQDKSSGGSDSDDVNYLLGTTIDLFENTQLSISHSRKMRFPTLRDLFEPGRANPDLKPERIKQYEISLRHNLEIIPVNLGFTVFRTDAEDFIETDNNGIAQNIEENRFEGIEVTAEISPLDVLNVRAGYTYLDSENLSTGITNRDLQNRPEHQLSVETVYQFPWENMFLYFSWQRVKGNLELSRQPPILTRETGDYDVVDLKLEKTFRNFSVFGRILNLLDEDYVESGGFPAPGRTVFFGGELGFGS